MFELARAAEMAVMPVGCRTPVTEPGLIDELPAGSLRVAVVTSGADILATVEDAKSNARSAQYVPILSIG